MGTAVSISQVTVSQMFVLEIPVSNTALAQFMKQSSAGVVTQSQRIGYVRVSTVAQTLDQQRDALEKAGVAKTFSDTMSQGHDHAEPAGGGRRRRRRPAPGFDRPAGSIR